MNQAGQTPPRRRRSLTISLRVFAAMVLVVGGWMGLEAHRARTQRIAVATIEKAGGRVELKGRFTSGSPWAPNWLTSRCGLHYFVETRTVSLGMESIPDEVFTAVGKLGVLESFSLFSATTDSDLARLAASVRARELYVHVNGRVTDEGLSLLASCTSVEKLSVSIRDMKSFLLRRPVVREAWLARLVELPRLRELSLGGFKIGDAGIAHLGKLNGLQELDLATTTDLTTARLVALKQFPALRRLKISIFRTKDINVSDLERLPFALDLTVDAWDQNGAESPLLINIGRVQRIDSLRLWDMPYNKFPRHTWERLEGLRNLRELHLQGKRLSERDCEGISRLGQLEKLELFYIDLANGGLKHICKMHGLKELTCLGPRLNATETAQLQRALPLLKITQR